MGLLKEIAPGAIAPAAIAASILFVGALLSRRSRRDGARAVASGLALASGFAAGFLLVLGSWPALPLSASRFAGDWVAWIAVAALLLGLAETFARLPRVPSLLLRLAAAAGAAWLILAPHAGLDPGQRWAHLGIAAAGIAILWTAAAALAARGRGPGATAVPLLVATGMFAATLALTSGSLSMGRTVGALASAIGGALVVGVLADAPAVSRAGAAVVALVFGGLLVAAHGYLNYEDARYFPTLSALLFLVAPWAGMAAASRAVGRGAGRLAVGVAGALPTLLLAALAWWIAHANRPPPNPYAY